VAHALRDLCGDRALDHVQLRDPFMVPTLDDEFVELLWGDFEKLQCRRFEGQRHVAFDGLKHLMHATAQASTLHSDLKRLRNAVAVDRSFQALF